MPQWYRTYVWIVLHKQWPKVNAHKYIIANNLVVGANALRTHRIIQLVNIHYYDSVAKHGWTAGRMLLYAFPTTPKQIEQTTLANVIFIIKRLLLLCTALIIQCSAVNTCQKSSFFSLSPALHYTQKKPSRAMRMHSTSRAMPMQMTKSDFRFLLFFFSSAQLIVTCHLFRILLIFFLCHNKPQTVCTKIVHCDYAWSNMWIQRKLNCL